MKELQITAIKGYDRYVLIEKTDGKITNIDFMQGLFDESYQLLLQRTLKPDNILIEIYNRLQKNKKFMQTKFNNELEEVNHCIELYTAAYIFSEVLN
jgi:ribonucleotide reductase beta subunit family protein with ferritin-like domain